jgi:hypothetical protein
MDATRLTLLHQNWQSKAFDLYETEGHLYYATNYVGSALARIKLVAAMLPEDDEISKDPVVVLDGPLTDAIKNIQSARGGQIGLLRQMGRNIFLTGESWLVAEELSDGSQMWDAVSIDELEVQGTSTTFTRRRLPGQQPEPLPPGSLTIRIWKESPRFSELADSGVRSCMEILEKIVVLNRAEKAIARSRLAGSGILALPQELVPPAWQNQNKTPNAMEANPLWSALAESMTAPLSDEAHPSAVVPLLLVGPGDTIGKMKYEPMERKFDAAGAQASIMAGIEQVANTLELPKEVLLGNQEATHFTAWAVREDTYQAHIQPLIELICSALTRTYLQQALKNMSPEQLKEIGIDDMDRVIVWYDASELVQHPDKSDKALALHDRLAISDKALRDEVGFDDSHQPDEEERNRRIGVKMAQAKMAVTGEVPEDPMVAQPAQASGPKA